MQNTATAYVGGHSHQLLYTIKMQYSMEENSSLIEVLGEKNQIRTYWFKLHYLGKRINE